MATPFKLMQRMTVSSETERLREVNNKMQRCLEEALMKNISLQEVNPMKQHCQWSVLHVYTLKSVPIFVLTSSHGQLPKIRSDP